MFDRFEMAVSSYSKIRRFFQRLGRPGGIKAEADATLRAIVTERRALDEAERQAWSRWAANPADEPEPAVQTEKRADLDRRLALARRDAEAAERASAAVAVRQLKLGRELREVGVQLYALEVDSVVAEAEDLNREITELVIKLARASERLGIGHAVRGAMERALTSRGRPKPLQKGPRSGSEKAGPPKSALLFSFAA